MVEEVGFNSRLRVQAGAPLPGVSADSFGAGVGAAIGQAGQVIQQEQGEDRQIERNLRDNSEWSAFLVEDAKAREELSLLARDGRLSDEPGHAERIAAQLDQREAALLGGLSSKRLQEQGRARVAEWGGRLRTGEADFEFVRQQEIGIERFDEQRGIALGRIRRLEKPDDYLAELKLQVDGINGLNTSDKIKQKLIDETEQLAAVAFLRGMTDRDPVGAKAMIDSGGFDGVLTGDQVEALRNGADVEIRRADAQREREQGEQRRAIAQKINLFEQAERLGLIEDESAFDEAIAAATAIGDEQSVLTLTVQKANRAFTRALGPENATALQREQRLGVLAAKTGRTDVENLELAFLRKNNSAWAAEEARDPVTQAARRGGSGAPPEIDIADGASWNARAGWMVARGGSEAFKDVELRELQSLLSDPRGELEVLGQLDKVTDQGARARMARQIAPNDPTFTTMAMLRPQPRAVVRQGKKALADNPKFFSETIIDLSVADELSVLDQRINMSLREFDQDVRSATRDVMRQFLAGTVTGQGGSDFSGMRRGDSFDRLLRIATAVALGGSTVAGKNGERVIVGGIDDWNGRPYALPNTINEGEFKRRLKEKLANDANPPVNPDGSPANLFAAFPVAVGEQTDADGNSLGGGWYEWESASGNPIKTKDGRRYRVRLGR